jgi:predicted metal-binding transcription factor (methanogenesis marker protein 9)
MFNMGQAQLSFISRHNYLGWMRVSKEEYERLRNKLSENLLQARSITANTNNSSKIRDEASRLAEKLRTDIQAIDDIMAGKRTEKSYWDTKPGTSLGSILGRQFGAKRRKR